MKNIPLLYPLVMNNITWNSPRTNDLPWMNSWWWNMISPVSVFMNIVLCLNLGILKRNWFSHPNIAEVVWVHVTPINWNKLYQCFQSCLEFWSWIVTLNDFCSTYSATLMLTHIESYQLYHVIKSLSKSRRYLWIQPQLKSRDSRIPRFQICSSIPALDELPSDELSYIDELPGDEKFHLYVNNDLPGWIPGDELVSQWDELQWWWTILRVWTPWWWIISFGNEHLAWIYSLVMNNLTWIKSLVMKNLTWISYLDMNNLPCWTHWWQMISPGWTAWWWTISYKFTPWWWTISPLWIPRWWTISPSWTTCWWTISSGGLPRDAIWYSLVMNKFARINSLVMNQLTWMYSLTLNKLT